jgi:hypothetical protein
MTANLRSRLAAWVMTWLPDIIISGYLPAQIGRYRVVDMLIVLADGGRL